ncbi:flagellar basal body P-ring formation chaperone FlgA [Shimia thalassica]|uniref:flagellar basal body P-ring formation chaperone FlgA n=1 Tax=Shimia thalassica TaxID=1715693 RepID=UPI0026E4192A|nr:flagellar basal body P-ring formation chaperone FlgA [Shimia thalassica]MDO6479780.1 flagellar basal body P-ring formation chaperone FlgA [Shimia thalassica]MDO6485470.1 flagellar basal body P-ring formation chaperone FlgA [Shimia thalassica]
MKILSIALCLLTHEAVAQSVVPTRTIRPLTVITSESVSLTTDNVPGTYTSLQDVIGFEARIVLYPGRPIFEGDIAPPAIVERNAIVPLIYSVGGLTIATDGRSLTRASAGDSVRVLNLESRTPVRGKVQADGSVLVSR